MVKTLNLMTSGSSLPLADSGLKFSKQMLVEKIELHEDFKNLYVIDDQVLERIVNAMKETGFDNSQPVHIWHTTDKDGIEHWYLIDGYTRLKASGMAGITRVPIFEHNFESFEEAFKYVLKLQVNRRNLDNGELIRNVALLLDMEHVRDFEGDKAELISEELGVSKRTVQKAMSLGKNADESLLDSVKRGEVSLNQAYTQMQEQRGPSTYETKKSKEGKKKSTVQNCKICDFQKVVFYLLSKIQRGESPESLLAESEVQQLLRNPSGFALPQSSLEIAKALGYESYISGEL